MDTFILIAVVILCAGASLTSAAYGKRERCNGYLFTAGTALVSCFFFFAYNRFRFQFDPYTVKISLLFAAAYLTCTIASVYAYRRGSVAITSMISAFSLLLPAIFNIVYWKESAGWGFLPGILCFLISIVLVNLPEGLLRKKEQMEQTEQKEQKEKRKLGKPDPIWLILVFFVFFANGMCSISQTFHQKALTERSSEYMFQAEFMISALLTVFVVNLAVALCMLKKSLPSYLPNVLRFAPLYGVMNGVVNLGVMLLTASGKINSSVFFPIISVGSLIIVLIASLLLFRERLRLEQYIGVAAGIASIVFLQF